MEYCFGPAGILPSLGLGLEEVLLPAGAGCRLPQPFGLLIVLSGSLAPASRGAGDWRGPACAGGQALIRGAPGGEGVLARAGKDGACYWSLALDRDPAAELAARFRLDRGSPATARPWRPEPRIVEPGREGMETLEALASGLSRALGEAGQSRGAAAAAEYLAAAALARCLELLARAPAPPAAGPASAGPVGRTGPWSVAQVRAWIDSHYEESFSLDEMVARCALNTSDFSRAFKAQAGAPLFEYLNRRRIERAALLLKDGDLSVTEIAFSVGYNNLSFFNRYFLRLMRQTPTEYRRHARRLPRPPAG